MLAGYVSDENFVALADVAVEFQRDGECVAAAHSTASGAIYAEVAAGEYRVILNKPGFGPKWSLVKLHPGQPVQFRLMSDSLCGYVWPKWARSGDRGECRIHSPEGYHLSLWRYGARKELVENLGVFDEHGPRACLQLLPDGDFTQSGVDWNRTGYGKPAGASAADPSRAGADAAASCQPGYGAPPLCTAPERSGLYFFHAETPAGKFFSFPWVVAPRAPQSSIAVLASTNTWNAYNNFGGRSNYINPTQLNACPTVNARLDLARYDRAAGSVWSAPDARYRPLSFDRPEPFNHIPKGVELTDALRSRQGCHLAEAEWRLLGWLEREGFAADLYADHQLHSGLLDLDAYRVLILNTHPEYWSRAAYDRVKRWVFERGGKLLYLGGNGIDCEVEFIGESRMRCKTWLPNPSGALEFIHPLTGARFESRFHHQGESQAQLLGVVFTESGCSTAAPFQVLDAGHWAFAGTGLGAGDRFGARSLHERCPGGASGHETDKRTASSPSHAALLARGLNAAGGGAELVFFQTPSGGAVFSAGSITWTASVLVDPHVSAITRNVLQRFLAPLQPGAR